MNSNNSAAIKRARWLVRATMVNGAEHTLTVSLEELRTYIDEVRQDRRLIGTKAGLINKYLFPLVLDKYKDREVKHIKVRGIQR